MAFTVAIEQSSVKYPPICPFCETRNVSRWITRSHSRPTGFYVIFYTYSTYKIEVPICNECYSKSRKLFWFGLALIPLLFLIPEGLQSAISPSLLIGSIALLVYRWWWLGKVKPMRLHGAKGSFVLLTRSMNYARQLATMNNTTFEAYASFTLT